MRQIPFSTFKGRLKQLDISKTDKLFGFFFPRFSSLEERRWLEAGGESEEMSMVSESAAEMIGRGRERRFAGDETLGRGRYHALVDSPLNPPQNNTLLREILAYASPTALVRPELIDTTVDLDMVEQLARDCPPMVHQPAVLLLVRPHGYGALPKSLDVESGATTIIPYPLKVTAIELDNVIDLRRPSTLDWLVETFVPLEEQAATPGSLTIRKRNPPRSGFELIPTLLAQMLGGGSTFIQGIGAWLRTHGAKALIYPSARSDCFVSWNGNEITESCGFIFLDYRNAPSCQWERYFGQLPSWVDKEARHIEVSVKADGDAGIWGTEKVLVLQQNRFAIYRGRVSTIFQRALKDLASGASKLSDQLNVEGAGAIANVSWIGASIGDFLAGAFPSDPEVRGLVPYWRYDGKSWFIHRTGTWDAELCVRCPICSHEALWPVLRGFTANACRACGFSNGIPETREAIRERWLP
jgi:hypothetical protein